MVEGSFITALPTSASICIHLFGSPNTLIIFCFVNRHNNREGSVNIFLMQCKGHLVTILISLVRSKPLSDWKSGKKTCKMPEFFFKNSLPLKFYISKIFKRIVESSLIAHLIGNFTLKNVITSHFFDKMSRWWDMMSYIILFMYYVTKSLNMR